MAHVYPTPIGPTRSRAERELYRRFSEQLSDEFTVFHQVAWLGKLRGAEPDDGEADFVIAHPDLGVLVVEVKGGGIEHDGQSNVWMSIDGSGGRNTIKDPFAQVAREARALKRVAEDMPDWPTHDVRFVRAVALPDVDYRRLMVPHGPAEIVIDEDDCDRLQDRVCEIFDWWSYSGDASSDGGAPGSRGVEALVTLLARSFRIDSPLHLQIASERRAMLDLTEQQFRLLDFLRHQRHALILGVAGAGKTLLAVEHARRLARQGMRVLLTCVDRPLANHLRATVGRQEGVEILTFRELAHSLAADLGRELGKSADDAGWRSMEVKDILDEAVNQLDRRYDAIVVDEAQDVPRLWWPAVYRLLSDETASIFYLLGDDNQDLYHTDATEYGVALPDDMPIRPPRFEMIENRRTTKAIHDFAVCFGKFDGEPISAGPPGRPIEFLTYPTVDPDEEGSQDPKGAAARACLDQLRRVLHRISREGGVPTRDIVVLTPVPERGESWLGQEPPPKLGPFKLVRLARPDGGPRPEPRTDEIRFTTVSRFKGLEAPVVILVEVDGRVPPDRLPSRLYVGATRAQSHLVVIADEARAQQLGPAQHSLGVHD